MSGISLRARGLLPLALLAVPAAGAWAQDSDYRETLTVEGSLPADLSGLPEGPEIEGIISARKGGRLQITGPDGGKTVVTVGEATDIRATGGFLGMDRERLGTDSLLNGLPVAVTTVHWGDGLAASRIELKSRDLRMAEMIQRGTEQGFAEQTAATEALRSRVADIDQYTIRGTTKVYFDTGKAVLVPEAKEALCATVADAEAMDNALLLVVGYTDSTGSPEINQALSEKRAGAVVNYLQQVCGWKPYRMLSPTGMAEADPLADNETPYGKAQNRRVEVNIMVSKAIEGL